LDHINFENVIGAGRCTVDAAGVGSHTTQPRVLTITKVRSDLSQGFVEGIELDHAASSGGNTVQKSIPTIHKGRPFIMPLNLSASPMSMSVVREGSVMIW
jgi:hypothetical protein